MMGKRWLDTVGVVALGLSLVLSFGAVAAQEATPATGEAQATEEAAQPAQEATPAAQSQQAYLGVGYAAAETGVQVTAVAPNSPAEQTGVQANDVITAFDGQPVTVDSLVAAVSQHAVGDTVTLTVQRGEQSLDLTATLAARPAMSARSQRGAAAQPATMPYIGVSLSEENNAVTVQDVTAGSPAETAGFQVGDVITKIGDSDVKSAGDVVTAVRAAKPGDPLTLHVTRSGEDVTLNVTVGETATQPMNRGMHGMPGMQGMMNGNAFAFDGTTWSIQSLDENSALYKAGLRAGDQITAINGESNLAPQALMQTLMDAAKSDQTVPVTVTREGSSQTIDVPASALHELVLGGFGGFPFGHDENGSGFPFEFGQRMSGLRLGVQVVNLDETTAQEHNLTVTDGALVTAVEPGSAAEKAGLKVNDVITAVDGDPVTARRPLAVRLYGWKAGDEIALTVLRDGQSLELKATLEDAPMGNGQGIESPLQFFFGDGGQNGNGFDFQLPFPNIQQPQAQQLPAT